MMKKAGLATSGAFALVVVVTHVAWFAYSFFEPGIKSRFLFGHMWGELHDAPQKLRRNALWRRARKADLADIGQILAETSRFRRDEDRQFVYDRFWPFLFDSPANSPISYSDFTVELVRLSHEEDPLVQSGALEVLSHGDHSPYLSGSPEARSAAFLALTRLLESPGYADGTRSVLHEVVKRRPTSEDTEMARYAALYTLTESDAGRSSTSPANVKYGLGAAALRNLPVYDIDKGRIRKLNSLMREYVESLGPTYSTGSPELDELQKELEEDPMGTAYGLMFGDGADRLGREGQRALDDIFERCK